MWHPVLELAKNNHRRILKEAQLSRIRRGNQAKHDAMINRLLSIIGDVLISVGLRLKGASRSSGEYNSISIYYKFT